MYILIIVIKTIIGWSFISLEFLACKNTDQGGKELSSNLEGLLDRSNELESFQLKVT